MGEPASLVTEDQASGRSWCLRRVGMNAEWLLLEDGREQNPEGQWTIMDNKGVCSEKAEGFAAAESEWLNREHLEPLKLYFIHKGDHIQLGVPLENKENAEQTQKGSSKKIMKMEQELQDLQSQLYAEQAQQQARVEQLEKTFQEEEQHLQHQTLMEEINRSKKDFETIIQAKNKELEQTKEEKEKVQTQKEEVLSHMNDVLENELQGIICSEYFIEAVTLNCAHSFCSYCINEWMKRKIECPICRKDIESKTHSLVLDNCINKMVDNLSSEVKE
uniref:E3 ubiquitin-protein ligase RNF8-like n=1 Tax=Ictidomys tridecemlineatus TaxID=43179 RepID=UPI001A9DCE87|nr:E3 ubiquitin-protein ligase RNF8-like [Ictidomys tridecemlineatus]